jgi:hypothetical protein
VRCRRNGSAPPLLDDSSRANVRDHHRDDPQPTLALPYCRSLPPPLLASCATPAARCHPPAGCRVAFWARASAVRDFRCMDRNRTATARDESRCIILVTTGTSLSVMIGRSPTAKPHWTATPPRPVMSTETGAFGTWARGECRTLAGRAIESRGVGPPCREHGPRSCAIWTQRG